MDVRITPLSNFTSPIKTGARNNEINKRNQFNTLNLSKVEFDKLRSFKPRTVKTSPNLSNLTGLKRNKFLFVPENKLRSSNSNLLFIPEKNNNPARLSIKISSDRIQPPAVAEKKRSIALSAIRKE